MIGGTKEVGVASTYGTAEIVQAITRGTEWLEWPEVGVSDVAKGADGQVCRYRHNLPLKRELAGRDHHQDQRIIAAQYPRRVELQRHPPQDL